MTEHAQHPLPTDPVGPVPTSCQDVASPSNPYAYSAAVDEEVQEFWDKIHLGRYEAKDSSKKLYCLEMFSYPSAAKLHVGHWYNYALSDTWARFKKMQGYEVFQPMGFDAFGLPAENYAIKTGVPPADSTHENIRNMKDQLRSLGGMFDWDHEVITCEPEYYRWTQWLFTQLYKHGLAYRKKSLANWCPSCQTVLANEQVLGDGTCERCGTEVERKKLTQWFFKITDYAEELLSGLHDLDWPEKTKKIQENWIGRSEGANIQFYLEKDGHRLQDEDGQDLKMTVFTTRADTLMGLTYVVVAPDSDLCPLLTTEDQKEVVEAYLVATSKVSDIDRQSTVREKTGVFTGSYAIHPITGEKLPIWTADYVLATYGTGCVMAVPAHDIRDYAFAKRYELPIKEVIRPAEGEAAEEDKSGKQESGQSEATLGSEAFTEDGVLFNSGAYDDLTSEEARKAIVEDLKAQGMASFQVNYRLRDWLVSRQRYWGAPIPVVYCPHCGTVVLEEKDLPVLLPKDVEFKPTGQSPLAECESFMNVKCPKCGTPSRRDPDTLDTFVCSSWYEFRYTDNKNDKEAFSKDKVKALCPVDKYVGGAEHAAMHLLYSRFICKALRDMGYLDFDEPFLSLVHQGIILGSNGEKMSKSRGNSVNPDDYVGKYGSDVLRMYLGFAFAYSEGGPWSNSGIAGMAKFFDRVVRFLDSPILRIPNPQDLSGAKSLHELTAEELGNQENVERAKALRYQQNYAIKEVSADLEHFEFNTAIARLMEYLNALQKLAQGLQEAEDQGKSIAMAGQLALFDSTKTFILTLAPLAPHFCEHTWQTWGFAESIFLQAFPSYQEEALVQESVEIVLQTNGKIRARLSVPGDLEPKDLEAYVRQLPEFKEITADREVRKMICVKNRLVNVVVK